MRESQKLVACTAAHFRTRIYTMPFRPAQFLSFATFLVLLFTGACGATGDDDDGNGNGGGDGGCVGAVCLNECPDGQMTTITGRVLAPNGIDPIPSARVYVPIQVTDFPPSVTCEICKDIVDNALVATTTNVDGTFTLGPIPTVAGQAAGEQIQLVSQKGRFRKVVSYTVNTPCGANTVTETDTQLPGANAGQDRVPNIAVVTGNYDQMECVLLNMGLETQSVHIFDGLEDPSFGLGGTPNAEGNFSDLLSNPAKMKEYNIIFVNCSANQYEGMLSDAAVRSNIENYVNSGGRLYVTDWSYDYLEQIGSFAGYIDFGPGMSDNLPEPKNQAAIGQGGITTEALIHDNEMADWLRAVEAVTGEEIISDDGRVHIEHFLPAWVMQLSVLVDDNVTLWLSGEVSGSGISDTLPLTTTFDYNDCGRVLYSSYHTLGRDLAGLSSPYPQYCDSTELSPQERVLMYLILHVADCIEVEID